LQVSTGKKIFFGGRPLGRIGALGNFDPTESRRKGAQGLNHTPFGLPEKSFFAPSRVYGGNPGTGGASGTPTQRDFRAGGGAGGGEKNRGHRKGGPQVQRSQNPIPDFKGVHRPGPWKKKKPARPARKLPAKKKKRGFRGPGEPEPKKKLSLGARGFSGWGGGRNKNFSRTVSGTRGGHFLAAGKWGGGGE